MRNVSLDVSKLKGFINEHEIGYMGDMVNSAHNAIHNGTGAGNDFLGWLDLPKNYDKEEFERIKKCCRKNKGNFRCINSNRNWWIIFRSKSCN